MVELNLELVKKEREKRWFRRFDTQLEAKYFLKENKGCWKKCTIVNVSQKGMGITFQVHEKINVSSTILLEISVPSELEPNYIIGMLRWIRQRRNDFMGGIESTEVLDDVSLYYSPLEK